LLIDSLDIGGAERMVLDTALLLKNNLHEPIVLHFGNEYLQGFCIKNNIKSQVIPNHKLYKKTIYLPLFIIRSINYIVQLELDCLHTHLYGSITSFSLIAFLAKTPHIGTLHDIYMVKYRPLRLLFIKFTTLLSTRLVVVSKDMMKYYLNVAKISEKDIICIPNFAYINKKLNERDETRRKLNIDKENVCLISTGRLVHLKRFDFLINILSELPDSLDYKCIIVGDGPEYEKLNSLIINLNLVKKVILLGERHDIYELLSAGDIFILTSETEGMSKSILEALASALPVIATDVGGNSELVKNSFNGYLFEQNDYHSMRDRIIKLVINKEERIIMGENSLKILNDNYTDEIFIRKYIKAYISIKHKNLQDGNY